MIREAQFGVFRERLQDVFVRQAAAALCMHWPNACAELGQEALQERVRLEIEEAAKFGFVLKADVLRYINLTFALGTGFATDPKFPWAARICGDRRVQPNERLDRLMQKAVYFLEGRQVA